MNVRAAFLLARGFAALLGPKEKRGHIVDVVSAAAVMVFPGMSSYSVSKLAAVQLQAFIAAEHPNITAVAQHPGMVPTDMTMDYFRPFSKDTHKLVGGLGVWLSTDKASFLNGKYIESNWSVDELVERKGEIIQQGKLSVGLVGEFGSNQFAT